MTLQVYLGQGIDSLLEVVDTLQLTVESFSKQMISMQRDMSADIKEMKMYLARAGAYPALQQNPCSRVEF